MCDKMAVSAHILKIVENDPFLRLQMTAKEILLICIKKLVTIKHFLLNSLGGSKCVTKWKFLPIF